MITLVQERLNKAFAPTALTVIDESAQHVGHPGARAGAGHFAIQITSTCFNNLPRLAQHRMIYQALVDLIPHKIHALKIHIGYN